MEWECRMDASAVEASEVGYTTPPRVQAWFLGRSRDRWKRKYMNLKAEARRLQKRVADVTKSREKWRHDTGEFRHRVAHLEAQTPPREGQAAALQNDSAHLHPRPL